ACRSLSPGGRRALANGPPECKFDNAALQIVDRPDLRNAPFPRRRGFAAHSEFVSRGMASIARNRGVGASALTAAHFLLLYAAMLVAAAGNTALQSVIPAIGREIGIKDFYVAIAYTWSAVLWVLLAPYWAEKSDHHGRKT